jgi:hypothetical protein
VQDSSTSDSAQMGRQLSVPPVTAPSFAFTCAPLLTPQISVVVTAHPNNPSSTRYAHAFALTDAAVEELSDTVEPLPEQATIPTTNIVTALIGSAVPPGP